MDGREKMKKKKRSKNLELDNRQTFKMGRQFLVFNVYVHKQDTKHKTQNIIHFLPFLYLIYVWKR